MFYAHAMPTTSHATSRLMGCGQHDGLGSTEYLHDLTAMAHRSEAYNVLTHRVKEQRHDLDVE